LKRRIDDNEGDRSEVRDEVRLDKGDNRGIFVI